MLSPTAPMESHVPHYEAWGTAEPTRSPDAASTAGGAQAHSQPHLFNCRSYSRHHRNIKPLGQGHKFSYQPSPDPEDQSLGSPSPPPPSPPASYSDVAETTNHRFISGASDNWPRAHNSLPESISEANDSDREVVNGAHLEFVTDSNSLASDNWAAFSSTSGEIVSANIAEIHSPSPRNQSETLTCNLVIEEIDLMDSESEALEVLMPTEIESARSRSQSRRLLHLDKEMMKSLKNLNCSNQSSENEEPSETSEEKEFRIRQQELRRLRRISMSSSFGKRTHSEMSDSEDDDRDVLDVNDVGSSAKRMRKRLHRGSLLFQDSHAPRIDELDEPDSSDNECAIANSLARELPFWASEIMEISSD